jgi:hypothetical protein
MIFCFYLGLASDHDPLTYASCIAGITGVHHHTWCIPNSCPREVWYFTGGSKNMNHLRVTGNPCSKLVYWGQLLSSNSDWETLKFCRITTGCSPHRLHISLLSNLTAKHSFIRRFGPYVRYQREGWSHENLHYNVLFCRLKPWSFSLAPFILIQNGFMTVFRVIKSSGTI